MPASHSPPPQIQQAPSDLTPAVGDRLDVHFLNGASFMEPHKSAGADGCLPGMASSCPLLFPNRAAATAPSPDPRGGNGARWGLCPHPRHL